MTYSKKDNYKDKDNSNIKDTENKDRLNSYLDAGSGFTDKNN